MIDCWVELLFHLYVYPAGAVSKTLPPVQKVNGPPAVIKGCVRDKVSSVTVTILVVVKQLLPSVTVAKYDPD